jgi:nucleoside-diphosphate-sugar epimerase
VKVLVTGATGRVGSRFVPRLVREESVRAIVRDPSQVEPLAALGVETFVGDLGVADDRERAVAGVDAIVHLAAAVRGLDDDTVLAVNRDATVALAEAALDAGVGRFVYASSTLVCGGGRDRPAGELDEPAPPPAYGAYAVSKAQAERALLDLHRTDGLGVRIARLAFVYGEGDPHLAESLLWAREWPLHRRFHLVHHADVGQGLMRALRAGGVDGRVYHLGDDAPVTALELLRLNAEAPAADAASRPLDDPWDGIVDTGRARRDLGFRPIYPTVYTAQDAGAL